MSDQLSLLAPKQPWRPNQAKAEGIAASLDTAGEQWADRVETVILYLADSRADFTAADLRVECEARKIGALSKYGWGAAVHRAATRGLIELTGEYRCDGTHGHRNPVWRRREGGK